LPQFVEVSDELYEFFKGANIGRVIAF